MRKTCSVTGRPFDVSEQEMTLRGKLGIEGMPDLHPIVRWQILGAFWQHWALYKRKCDKTGKPIVSVFAEDCPYPVWHKDEWIKHADPPAAEADPNKPLFPQMWELFRKSPIPHNVGAGNQNCEYTDDWWYCKNCYLCHSGYECEDLRYDYRIIRSKNCQYCVFTFDSEYSVDLINSHNCFRCLFLYNCWQCSESAFLYDCRNCSDCMFCTNLRNKSYCFANEQLTKEEYTQRRKGWDLQSRQVYEKAKAAFFMQLKTRSWHRALFQDLCENSTGNYLHECKNCEHCFFLTTGAEDAINVFRGGDNNKDLLDAVSPFAHTELIFNTSMPQDHCYDIRCCADIVQCKFMEYCAHCFQCEHCFGCCGLVGKKFCIFNKPYSPEEYEKRKAEIIAAMKKTGEYGKFFPGHFAANPYEESLSGFYWPLTKEEGKKLGFRMREEKAERVMDALDVSHIPDRSGSATPDLPKNVFWDSEAKRPFQIAEVDIAFAKDLGAPLPHTYYMRRLQENFRLIPFTGELRETACGKCKTKTQTSWPAEYDGRILCEECYLKEVY
jgi:hypothetical protein